MASRRAPGGSAIKPRDMTPAVDLTRRSAAGPLRTRRPVYVDLLPPCNHACPAGENIQAWLAFAQAGEYRQAWTRWWPTTPCRPCMAGLLPPVREFLQSQRARCLREAFPRRRALSCDLAAATAELGAPHRGDAERQAGADRGRRTERTVGRLSPEALPGHLVEIHEAGPIAGGMMHFGIPAYRLPRADLMREIAPASRPWA